MLKLIKILLLIVGALLLSCCMQSKDINTPAALDESVPTLSVEESDDPNAILSLTICRNKKLIPALIFQKNHLKCLKCKRLIPTRRLKFNI